MISHVFSLWWALVLSNDLSDPTTKNNIYVSITHNPYLVLGPHAILWWKVAVSTHIDNQTSSQGNTDNQTSSQGYCIRRCRITASAHATNQTPFFFRPLHPLYLLSLMQDIRCNVVKATNYLLRVLAVCGPDKVALTGVWPGLTSTLSHFKLD